MSKPAAPALATALASRTGFYYGWIVLGALCCAGFARQGPAVATLSIFVEPLTREFGWSRTVVLISVVSLILAALLLMLNLRSVYLSPPQAGVDHSKLEHDALVQLAQLLGLRGARFNVALYLTFFSVILLGFGAFEGALAS